MPVSRKKDYIRDIYMQIRKESVVFEPNDRIPFDNDPVGTGGKELTDSIGSVYYDSDTGHVCFRVFDQDGRLIVPQDGPRIIEEQLTSDDLKRLSEIVSRYSEMSIYRARNMSYIESVMDSEGSVTLLAPASATMDLMVDYQRNGMLEHFGALSVFRPEAEGRIYVEGLLHDGTKVNYPLSDLSDMGVSAVCRAVETEMSRKAQIRNDSGLSAADRKVKNIMSL